MSYLWGLDLSLSNTGIAIIDLNTYNPILVDSVKTKQNKKLNERDDHKERIKLITDRFDELNNTYPASIVAIEAPFVQHNKSTKAIMKVHGVTQRWFYHVPQYYYAPTTIKATIIYGQAKKEFVKEKLKLVYPYIECKNNDESDALAIAITYLIKNKLIKWDKKLKQ
ncbi:crossover junction endodeoxyribonuclease RuvC [Neobacillus sp. YIM B02564]|uniref:Crossover junction endodeoxyribonuclease RuvC n=1 Tax=Neobacillus paridis TaxID=2803862 RepID=A0ABS1TIW8_9BACI|nr:crossover junction endodeoxyribonuclease RuvC [Neobacillus paridis]MBL4951123.1 crossover junction endodeoxyribonuclease RuvC [Neobacillus paridis]